MNIEQAKKQFPIGTKVKYFPIIKDREHYFAEVRSEPWEVCGEVVIAITGRTGGVSVEHLELDDSCAVISDKGN